MAVSLNLSCTLDVPDIPEITVTEKLSQSISTNVGSLVAIESPTNETLRYHKQAILALFNSDNVTIPATLRDFYKAEDFEAGSKDGTNYARQPLASVLTLAAPFYLYGHNNGHNHSNGNHSGNSCRFKRDRTSSFDDHINRHNKQPDLTDSIEATIRTGAPLPFKLSPAQEAQVTARQQGLMYDPPSNAMYSSKNGVHECANSFSTLPPFPTKEVIPPPGPEKERTKSVTQQGNVSETSDVAAELSEVSIMSPTGATQDYPALSCSLSEFFCVEVEAHELKRCLDYTSSECKLAAWYGDAILAKLVSDKLFKDGQGNIGSMTRKKAHYVSNTTMKAFLLGHTDAAARLPDAASMSEHSFGTVFEALLELCDRKTGSPAAKNAVDKYCEWVDVNTVIPSTSISVSYCDFDTGYSGFTSFASVDSQNCESKTKLNARLAEDMETWLGETKAAKEEEAKVKAAKLALSRKPPAFFGALRSPAAVSEHIHNEMAGATWRSNKKYWYTDKYYRCCGVREGVLTCLRPLWIDASKQCHHPGSLNIPDSKAEFQNGASQYGRGKTPIWTCCNLIAPAPGCVSTLPGHFESSKDSDRPYSSSSYINKIKQWLKEYEHVVEVERNRAVGYGGVAQRNDLF